MFLCQRVAFFWPIFSLQWFSALYKGISANCHFTGTQDLDFFPLRALKPISYIIEVGTCLITWRTVPNQLMISPLCFSNSYSFLTSEYFHFFRMSCTTNPAFLAVCSGKIFILSCWPCCWSSKCVIPGLCI